MKITKLMVEDFGKFHQEEFLLGNGINVVTGANESGKTTLRQFICAMWYGLERERGLKARKDEFTRYKPWYSGRFQGSMEFEAEGAGYRLSRNFLTKEVRLLCLDNGQEAARPEECLRELGLPAEEVYRNTYWIGNECRTEEILAESYRNHMANYAHTGGMNLKLAQAEERLKKIKREIEKKIPERELLDCMEQISEQKELTVHLGRETETLLELEKRYGVTEQRLNAARKELEACYDRIRSAERKQVKQQKGEWLLLVSVVLGGLLAGVCGGLIQNVSASGALWLKWIGMGIVVLGTAVSLPIILKNKNHGKKEAEEQAELLQREINASFEEVKQILPQIEKGRVFLEQTEERLKECETATKRYEELFRKKAVLEKEVAAVSLAMRTLNEIAAQMYREYGDEFYRKLSEYVRDFTDRAYERLVADEELKLRAITEDRSVEVADVSHGTGEQFYMALRFAAADVFDPEKRNPVILDDSFAAFDEQRMESTLLSLHKSGRQLLIFSSTGREEQTLRRMGVSYEKVFKKTRQGSVEWD